jgi:RNA polymerase sigma factor (sigma-70 family)
MRPPLDDFAAVFDRHWPVLRRYCVSRAGPAGEDVAAETFRVAYDQRDRFDPTRADVRTWLFGIATNLLRHLFRSTARHDRAVQRLDAPWGDDEIDTTLDRLEAKALGPELTEALHGLHAGERDALLLHVWADLTYEQVATALDVPVGTVRSRIHRARTRLRTHLTLEITR